MGVANPAARSRRRGQAGAGGVVGVLLNYDGHGGSRMSELVYEKCYGDRLTVSVRPCTFIWSKMLSEMGYQYETTVDLYGQVTCWPAKTIEEAIGTADAWFSHHMHFDIQPSERKAKG